MIAIKYKSDLNKISNVRHRVVLRNVLSNLDATVSEYNLEPWNPDENGYSIYIQNLKDDITKDVPHLNNSEEGLLCFGTITQDPPHIGWCWEAVTYFEKAKLYEIVIIMNDDFGIGYYVPNDEFINKRLKEALDEMHSNGSMETKE